MVSMFTDATAPTVSAMLGILQENSESVLCLGSSYMHENAHLFGAADLAVSVHGAYIQEAYTHRQNHHCVIHEDAGMTLS